LVHFQTWKVEKIDSYEYIYICINLGHFFIWTKIVQYEVTYYLFEPVDTQSVIFHNFTHLAEFGLFISSFLILGLSMYFTFSFREFAFASTCNFDCTSLSKSQVDLFQNLQGHKWQYTNLSWPICFVCLSWRPG